MGLMNTFAVQKFLIVKQMKTITQLCTMLFLVFSTTINAQKSATEALEMATTSLSQIEESRTDVASIVRSTVIQYVFGRTINTAGFLEITSQDLAIIEEYADELNFYADQVGVLSNGLVDLSTVSQLAAAIEGVADKMEVSIATMAEAINLNNRNQVYASYVALYNQNKMMSSMIQEIKVLIENVELVAVPAFYTVTIRLEDGNGNEVPAATLPGYYAQNVATGEYFYAGEGQGQESTIFEELEAGTYVFGAYDGYFDGASSATVTLSEAADQNGVVTVILSYWSE